MSFVLIQGCCIMLSQVITEDFSNNPASLRSVISYGIVSCLWLTVIVVLESGLVSFDKENDAAVLARTMPEIYSSSENKLERFKNADASLSNNYSLFLGVPAFGNYIPLSTFEQIALDDALGYSQDWVRMSDAGGTIFSDSVFQMNSLLVRSDSDQGWLIDSADENIYEKVAVSSGYDLYKRKTVYPYAIFIDDLNERPTGLELEKNTFENQNVLSKLLFDKELFTFSEKSLELSSSESRSLTLSTVGEQAVYLYTDGVDNISVGLSGKTICSEYPQMPYNGLIPIGTYDNEVIEITISNNTSEPQSGTLYVGMMDMQKYKDTIINAQNNDILTIDSIETGNRNMDMELTAEKEGYIFIPLYAENGWSIFINGNRIVPEIFFDVFFLIPVDKGKNEINLSFFPRKIKSGIIISLISILCLLLSDLIIKIAPMHICLDKCLSLLCKISCIAIYAAFTVALIIVYIVPVIYQLIMW